MDKFALSSDDCLVLLAVRSSRSLREAARLLGCDAGGLLRKVQRIAANQDVLRKSRGHWELTEKGLALVAWTQESILSQKKLLLSESVLRIASTTWFAERVLIPETASLGRQLGDAEIQFLVPADAEAALAEGDCDFVVVCHPPSNPALAHRRICPERWSVVAPARLAGKRGARIPMKELAELPFVRHHDLNPAALIPEPAAVKAKAAFSADNLTGIRAALLAGLGWSYVPTVLVRAELEAGTLVEVEGQARRDRDVCLWWVRGSAPSRKKAAAVEAWLRKACERKMGG